MARYTGPSYKKSRRLGFSTLENGKDLARRPYAPGQHGKDRKKKSSEYGIQLQEKQKVRFMYGLTEKQFHKTFEKAQKMAGIAGENLLVLLESRLDNIVNHGHILVNGKKVDIPSYRVMPGDVISVKETSLNHAGILAAVEEKITVPAFLEFDAKKLTGKYVRLPERTELNSEINEQLIVEFYNR